MYTQTPDNPRPSFDDIIAMYEEELALTKQKLETSERHNKDLRDNAMRNEKASFEQVVSLVSQRDALLEAIRDSQAQEPVGSFSFNEESGYWKQVDKAWADKDGEKLYAKPVIIPESAAQLHIKELRDTLVAASSWTPDWVSANIELTLAEQPDTRALDKALLEAEIKGLYAAGSEVDDRISEIEAKLAELNKDQDNG